MHIVAVVGMTGSGKSEAVRKFLERGFNRVGFNDVVYAELNRLGLERIQENERPVRENLRKQHGMGVMAERSISFVDKLLSQGKNVVVESLYSWSEYKIMKEKYDNQFRVLAIYAPPEMRYRRLEVREERPISPMAARERDYTEIEHIEKGGPIVMADWTIINTPPLQGFFKAIDEVIDTILR